MLSNHLFMKWNLIISTFLCNRLAICMFSYWKTNFIPLPTCTFMINSCGQGWGVYIHHYSLSWANFSLYHLLSLYILANYQQPISSLWQSKTFLHSYQIFKIYIAQIYLLQGMTSSYPVNVVMVLFVVFWLS